MTGQDIVDTLQKQKQQLEEHMSEFLARCKTDADRATLVGAYARITEQWNTAANQALRLNDPLVLKLVGQINSLHEEIEGMIGSADDIASVLNKISAGAMAAANLLTIIK